MDIIIIIIIIRLVIFIFFARTLAVSLTLYSTESHNDKPTMKSVSFEDVTLNALWFKKPLTQACKKYVKVSSHYVYSQSTLISGVTCYKITLYKPRQSQTSIFDHCIDIL
jgi:hypothetical protein